MSNIYEGIETFGFEPHAHGWNNSLSPVLVKYAAGATNIIEVGSHEGASAIHMATNSTAHIYCVDTWLGSPEMIEGTLTYDLHTHPMT